MLKRLCVDRVPATAEEDVLKMKQKKLLTDYLEVQKKNVSKKRKLNAQKQKKETLLAEVEFLRRRHRYLLELQSLNNESKVQQQDSDVQRRMPAEDKSDGISKTVVEEPSQILHSVPQDKLQVGESLRLDEKVTNCLIEDQKVTGKPLRVHKKVANCLIEDKRIGKKKISWQDQMLLSSKGVFVREENM